MRQRMIWAPNRPGADVVSSAYLLQEKAMGDRERTAVTVSIHKTNGSEVRYLESENEYSFHNCPKKSCFPGMLAWLKAKYPHLVVSVGRAIFGYSHLRRRGG